jgi:hypothetical protein
MTSKISLNVFEEIDRKQSLREDLKKNTAESYNDGFVNLKRGPIIGENTQAKENFTNLEKNYFENKSEPFISQNTSPIIQNTLPIVQSSNNDNTSTYVIIGIVILGMFMIGSTMGEKKQSKNHKKEESEPKSTETNKE